MSRFSVHSPHALLSPSERHRPQSQPPLYPPHSFTPAAVARKNRCQGTHLVATTGTSRTTSTCPWRCRARCRSSFSHRDRMPGKRTLRVSLDATDALHFLALRRRIERISTVYVRRWPNQLLRGTFICPYLQVRKLIQNRLPGQFMYATG